MISAEGETQIGLRMLRGESCIALGFGDFDAGDGVDLPHMALVFGSSACWGRV